LVTEERSSRRRETTKAVQKLGNETREGNEEALTAYVTTGKGRMRGLARESRMIPEWHCCSLFAETGLRKIGQGRAVSRKRNRPFALLGNFAASFWNVFVVRLIPGLSLLRENHIFTEEKLGEHGIFEMDRLVDFLVEVVIAQFFVVRGRPFRRADGQNQAGRYEQRRPSFGESGRSA
jgi:hypothetical protein